MSNTNECNKKLYQKITVVFFIVFICIQCGCILHPVNNLPSTPDSIVVVDE